MATATATIPKEDCRVRWENPYWLVEVKSSAHGKWIVVGYHHTYQDAENDWADWRAA